jgi:glutathione peroxidase
MLKITLSFLLLWSLLLGTKEQNMASIYDFEVQTIEGETITMEKYRGKVLLIVNVASKCAFTPQYEGLEKLYEKYEKQGLVILGFPCNQFDEQESGSNSEIASFCRLSYSINFPMLSKIEVNGENTHPLYRYLKSQKSGFLGSQSIKWNFTKFLVDREGNVIERFASMTKPLALESDITALLK